jgi:aerobic-type carbon monoxide dehydrogenase small subunit (CoxS/CutS family)
MSGLPICLDINGRESLLQVALTDTLLSVLRDRMLVTSPKRGCNQGVCGACTVLIDGMPMRACLSIAANCEGRKIRTLEGMAGESLMLTLQDAFIAQGAVQCGFCTPGMLIAAHALLQANPHPSLDEIKTGLSGSLCRCTGYRKIIEAVQTAAESSSK